MSEFISKADLLNRNSRELPEKVIDVPGGGKVKIRALDGYNGLRASEASLADRVVIAVTHGMIQPKLTRYNEVMDFVRFHSEDAQEIASEIATLTLEFENIIEPESKQAKKN